MFETDEMNDIFGSIDSLLENINVDSINADSSGARQQLPAGYYLCKVDAMPEFHTKQKDDGTTSVSVKFALRTVNDGVDLENVNVLQGTANKLEFKYFSLKDANNIQRFISDMMKFKVDEKGNSLPAAAFKTMKQIEACFALINGKNIYIMISESQGAAGPDGKPTVSRWVNFITFERAEQLGLH